MTKWFPSRSFTKLRRTTAPIAGDVSSNELCHRGITTIVAVSSCAILRCKSLGLSTPGTSSAVTGGIKSGKSTSAHPYHTIRAARFPRINESTLLHSARSEDDDQRPPVSQLGEDVNQS